jgi:hypothetical protein
MSRPTYGEHWAKMWLDLARYADSAGYADDPLRTIWLYRDYVIDSINANKPLDRFTIEQVAGDLLPDATDEQRVATAFHRNTLTNSEGGTDDEEFRNAAIVDRVNTTMAVWMGTTMACAQCHTHKYDPITQEEYFRVFAIMNQTEDADRRDESPLLSVYTPDQQQKRDALQQELASVREVLAKVTPELQAARDAWVAGFPQDIAWKVIKPVEVVSKAGSATKVEDSDRGPVVTIAGGPDKDTYEVKVPIEGGEEALRAIRIETLSDAALPGNGPGHAGGNFVISKLSATWTPADNAAIRGRYGSRSPASRRFCHWPKSKSLPGPTTSRRVARHPRVRPALTARRRWRSMATPTAAMRSRNRRPTPKFRTTRGGKSISSRRSRSSG